MKNKTLPALISLAIILLAYTCKKSDSVSLATLSSTPVTNITFTTVSSGGIVTADGNSAVTARGVCWGTSSGPTTSGSKTSDGSGTGEFTSSVTGLTAGTTYFLRAYATNSAGTGYGDEVTFSTPPLLPAAVSTTDATSITLSTAVSGGNVTNDNGVPVTARGVCYGTSSGPTIAGTHTSDGSGTGIFISNLTSLLDGTQYFIRAYATNTSGTAYGNEVTFTTTAIPPENQLKIQAFAFVPQTLTISVNSTVKWKNLDAVAHTVTSDNSSWDSGTIPAGGTFKFTFTSTGTFNYHCTIHPGMTGTIIVQ
jgi:plastocyanin